MKRGILLTYDKTIGWACTEPSRELRSFVVKQHWVNKLSIHREGEPEDVEQGSKKRKPHPPASMFVRAVGWQGYGGCAVTLW